MNAGIARLRVEVAADREALKRQYERIEERDPSAGQDDAEVLALSLHFAFGAVEAILERTRSAFEGALPPAHDSHRSLVDGAALAIPAVRPAIIGKDTALLLHELRGFRHFLRHGYGAVIDPRRVADIQAIAIGLRPLLGRDFDALDALLEAIAAAD